jgi:hypothetical protein
MITDKESEVVDVSEAEAVCDMANFLQRVQLESDAQPVAVIRAAEPRGPQGAADSSNTSKAEIGRTRVTMVELKHGVQRLKPEERGRIGRLFSWNSSGMRRLHL